MGLLEDWGVTPDTTGSYPAQEPDEESKTDDGEGNTQPINKFLATRRARFAKEIEEDPTLRVHLAAMQMTEGESRGGTIESLLNRADMQGKRARDMLGLTPDGVPSVKSFYGPIRDAAKGRSNRFFEALKKIERNPKLLDTFDQYTRRALAGAHVIGGYTDQGMPTDPNGSARTGIKGLSFGDGNEFVDYAAGSSPDFGTGRAAAIAYRKFIEENIGKDDPEAAKLYASMAAPAPDVPGYHPRTGPRRAGSQPGLPYIQNEDGTYRLAEDGEAPNAMLYGPPRAHTKARPDYIRSGTPGLQSQYVPPEMRGPFRAKPKALPITTGSYTIGTPTVPPVFDSNKIVSADSDLPGLPLDEATPLPDSLANSLTKNSTNITIPSQVPPTPLIPENTIKPQDVPLPQPNPQIQLPPTPAPMVAQTPAPPPSVPISGPQAGDENLPRTEIVKKEAPTGDFLEKARDVLLDLKKTKDQLSSKAMSAVEATPLDIAAGVTAIPGLFGWDTSKQAFAVKEQAEKIREANDFAFGVTPTGKSLAEKGGALLGRNLTPAGTYTLPMTAGMMVADVASQAIGTANAKPLLTKDEAEKLLFPGIGNNQIGPQLPPRMVNTAAGPAELDGPSYRLLGYMGALTIGALFAPRIIALADRLPIGRPLSVALAEGPTDVERFSRTSDLLHTSHDSMAGLKRITQRINTDPVAINNINTRLDFETGAAVNNYTKAAVDQGEMRSPNFNFPVRGQKLDTTLVQLGERETPEVTQYMHLWNTLDEIREIERKQPQNTPGAPPPGPVVVRGMNKHQVTTEIHTMQNAPEGQMLEEWRTKYHDWQKAKDDFLYHGEYSVLTDDEYMASANRQNRVHQKDLDIENTDVEPARVAKSFESNFHKEMRFRIENESKGVYIDENVAANPRFARQISPEELRHNKSWEKNTVTFYRRGELERWYVDPFVKDTLTLDPHMPKGPMNAIINGMRRAEELTTTGYLAPNFAFTNLHRNFLLARMSPSPGMVGPTVLGTLNAVNQQLYPKLAKVAARKFDDFSNGWLGQVFGPQVMHGMSLKAAQIYDNSLLMQLQKHGGVHTSMFVDYNTNAQALNQAATQSTGMHQRFLRGLERFFTATGAVDTLNAIHNAPNFAYASRNIKRGVPIKEAAMSAKQITGDPQKIGRHLNSQGKPIRFEADGLFEQAAARVASGVGAAHEIGRDWSPWWNATTQGMKRVGRAYLDNPTQFVAKAYLYNSLPAAGLYMYTRGLGVDPNGRSYIDYAMNGRSSYNSLMTIYIPMPGRPAEDGIVLPLPHELSGIWALTTASLHHLTGSNLMNGLDKFTRAGMSIIGKGYEPENDIPVRSANATGMNLASDIAKVGFIPATPPLLGAVAGSLNYVTPNGPFGGAYQGIDEGYGNEGLDTRLEKVARALAPGAADLMLSGYAAFTHSPNALTGIGEGTKAMGTRMIQKTPMVRDILGVKTPMSGNTQITEDVFGDKGVLGKLTKYYQQYDPEHDRSSKKVGGSKTGRLYADQFLPPSPPSFKQGHRFVEYKPPANALYSEFMKELDLKLHKDTLQDRSGKPTGAFGMPSHMERYSEFTKHIQSLRKIGDSNAVTVQARIEQDPQLKAYMEENNLPLNSPPRVIRNFLETKRQETAKQILFTLKALEQDFQHRLGDPNFRFEDLDPTQPHLLPPGFVHQDFVPAFPAGGEELVNSLPKKSHSKKSHH